jgi:hypothetical protein
LRYDGTNMDAQQDIVAGDVVVLKSDLMQKMTVERVRTQAKESVADVAFFVNGNLIRIALTTVSLQRISR